MSDFISLNREVFAGLHQAIVSKCESILIQQNKGGLSTSNQQYFYGFQAGKNNPRSINEIVQKYLEENHYKDLDLFRNHTLNGRRLYNLVKLHEEGKREIKIKKLYLNAYLFFLNELNPKNLAELAKDAPQSINFRNNHSGSVRTIPIQNRPFVIASLIGLALLTISLLYTCNKINTESNALPSNPDTLTEDQSGDVFFRTHGELFAPADNSTVNEDITCRIRLENLPKGWHVWLFVERDTFVEGSRRVRYWAKEPKFRENGDSLKIEIQENYDPHTNYSKKFSISMWALNAHSDSIIEAWIQNSIENGGEFLPLKAVPYPRRQFNRIQNLTIVESP